MSSITINSNIAALNAQRRLGQSTRSLQDSFTRLSSGLRINKASDDAAGLAIAESLAVDRRVFNQGVRNLNDGVSLLSIADGALSELTNVTVRLTELAEQSSNGSLSNKQRAALDEEAQALKDEFNRIARTTEFNGQSIFDGDFGELRLQAGFGEDGGIVSNLGGAVGAGVFDSVAAYQTEQDNPGGTNGSYDVALGDLNGDGVLDLITVGTEDQSGVGNNFGISTVRLGVGDGTFGDAARYQYESGELTAIAVEDVNSDGILDLIAAGQAGSAGYATVRLGAGDGSFSSAVSFATETTISRDLVLADLNGDGSLDIVTGGLSGAALQATVLLGDGSGSFSESTTLSVAGASFVSAVEVADLNGDSILDLAAAGQNGALTTFLGQGDGTFAAGQSFSLSSAVAFDVDLGDINGDGQIDVIIGGANVSTGLVEIGLGQDDGTFGAFVSVAAESQFTTSAELVDINGDGVLDIATHGVTDANSGEAFTFLGQGDGTFDTPASFATGLDLAVHRSGLALGDLDGDGVLDHVAVGSTGGGAYGRAQVRLAETNSGVSGLLDFSLETMADARQALPVFKRKLEQIAAQRGEIGAFEARISTAINTIQVASLNISSAASQIRDADVAVESATLVRTQILQQAGAAVLAQANQSPALALNLLS